MLKTDFTATKWEEAEKKVKFAHQFIKFVESDFDKRLFPNWFYVRLTLTFNHIAHYDRYNFFVTFFTTTQDKVKFLRQTLQHLCYGDPAFTYSDVEKALQSWLRENGILARYERKLADEQEAADKAELARLQKKSAE